MYGQDHGRYQSPTVHGVEALKFLLEENSLNADDLAGILRVNRSTAYRILKGSLSLTANQVKKLATRFDASVDLLPA